MALLNLIECNCKWLEKNAIHMKIFMNKEILMCRYRTNNQLRVNVTKLHIWLHPNMQLRIISL